MIRLSDFEAGRGESDLRKTRYRKKDYVRLQVLRTVAGMCAASILVLMMVLVYFVDRSPWSSFVSEGLFTFNRLLVMGAVVLVWLILLIIMGLSTSTRATREYEESELRVSEYEQTLGELLALYEDERKEESA